jgi:hypothetical protein
METFFILSSIFIFSLFIIKGLESIRNKAYKSLNSTRVVKKSTSIVRLYRFDKMYDPQSYFYRLEREIMISTLPDDLINSELANLREQYNAYLEAKR